MNRRTLIQQGVLAALLAGSRFSRAVEASTADRTAAKRAAGGVQSRLGLQLFLVRELLAKDPRATLKQLADIGFAELEMFGFGGSVFGNDPLFGLKLSELKALFADLRLSVPTVHFTDGGGDRARIAETALSLGARHMILAMPTQFIHRAGDVVTVSGLEDLDHARRIAQHANELGAEAKRNGIGFAYHNHHMEFAKFGEVCAYDVLMKETDPSLVKMELDVGWAAVGGADPLAYLQKYAGRFVACHLKDFNPTLPLGTGAATPIPQMSQLVPPGEGILDFPKLLTLMDHTGVKHGYIEVDLPKGDPLDAARRGYTNLAGVRVSAADERLLAYRPSRA